jgi:ADP-heptose:LPS heptosyltransferase
MKILVVLFRTLGDVLMGTTVVRAIKHKYPDSQIDFITDTPSVNLLEGNPDISNIIVASNYFEVMSKYSKNYDKVYKLNMANHLDSCWHHLPEHQNQHLVEWYAKRADIKNLDDRNIYLYPSETDETIAEKVFAELPFSENIICIHTSSGAHGGVGSRVESKDWDVQYFNVLSERLLREGFKVVQVGVDGDKLIENNGVVNIFNKLSLKQLGVFLKKCKAYVGVDSGPSYIAGWSGIPTLVIMGATEGQSEDYVGPSVGPRNLNAKFISPKRPDHAACKPVPCYVNCQIKFNNNIFDKKNFSCIDLITVDDVATKLLNMLEIK